MRSVFISLAVRPNSRAFSLILVRPRDVSLNNGDGPEKVTEPSGFSAHPDGRTGGTAGKCVEVQSPRAASLRVAGTAVPGGPPGKKVSAVLNVEKKSAIVRFV